MSNRTIKVKVPPEILLWAIESSSSNVEELSDYFPTLQKWMVGESHPTIRQIEMFSKKTHIPLGFFFLKEAPKRDIFLGEFRTIKNQLIQKPSMELINTIEDMDLKQNWMRDYRKDIGFSELEYVGCLNESMPVKEAASIVRNLLSLSIGWQARFNKIEEALKFLRNQLEHVGVLVMRNGIVRGNTHRQLNVKEFRAFVLVDDIAPIIFINSTDSKNAQVFSLIHEFCHLLYNSEHIATDPTGTTSETLEKLCNKVAAEALLPNDLLGEKWNHREDPVEQINSMARIYKISSYVIAIKAKELSLITKDTLERIKAIVLEYYEKGRDKSSGSGGDFYNNIRDRISKKFTEAVITYTSEGRTQYTEAFKLLGVTDKTYNEFVKRVI